MTYNSISIVIVSWNARHHLETYLPSVVQTRYPDFEIIIADNASNDGTKEWVNQRFSDVKVITLDKNYGYCGGNNRAVKYTKGNIIIFLNNDVEVTPDWLNGINEAFNKDTRIAVVQPKLLSWHHKNQFEYAGAAGGFLDRYGYPFCRGRIFTTIEKDHGQYNTSRNIFWASGAAFAVRKSVFNKSGGFDERFEFHMEEIDLCWRIWNRGYRTIVEPSSVVYHLGGGSLPAGDPRKAFYNFRNSLYMLWKNYPDNERRLRLYQRYFIDSIAFLRFIFSGHFGEAGAIIKAYAQFLRNRNSLSRDLSVSSELPLMCPFSIVHLYYIHGKHTFRQLTDDNLEIYPAS